MLRVYCDSGAYLPELKPLEVAGLISLYTYSYENRNRKIKSRAPSSNPTWEEGDSTWENTDGLNWADYPKQSAKWPEILLLIGAQHLRDAKHLDSAYQGGCNVFLTSDQRDIASRSKEIHALLGIHVFHVQRDWRSFLALARTGA